jgi:hypothetical protein
VDNAISPCFQMRSSNYLIKEHHVRFLPHSSRLRRRCRPRRTFPPAQGAVEALEVRLKPDHPEALQARLAAPAEARPITVEIAPGELIDKITILQLNSHRINDAAKRHDVGTELAQLVAARDRAVPNSAELARLATELAAVNDVLCQIKDEIRLCERDEDFGPRFIALARSVYRTNDRRAALKCQTNELLGSKLIEEKSYAS